MKYSWGAAAATSLFFRIAFAASADDWTKRAIYQVVTDRFAIGNDSSPSCDTSKKVYCGGNWQGIINKLDYIQNMGFDAVWISPVVENVQGETSQGQAYHGYWPQNINAVNTNFGSSDELKALSKALHARDMYLMVDVVVNHLVANPTNTSNVWPETFDYSLLQPFGGQNSFHSQCFISDYNNQTDVEQCWLGDAGLPLLDLDTENSTVVSTMYSWIKNLVSEYSIDGLRVDTAKHIRQDFWPDFASNAGVYTVGEILIGNVTYAAPYTKGLDSVLDYPTYYAVYNAFTNGTSGNMSAIADLVTQAQDQYNHGTFYVGSFVENQDNPRIQSTVSDQSIVKNVMTWPFINDGIPILYYGQEQGYQGGNDPANREAYVVYNLSILPSILTRPRLIPFLFSSLWSSGFNTDNKPLLTHVKTLNAARKQAISSNSNFLTTKATFISQSDSSTLAVSKPPLLALLTNGGSSSNAKWSIPSGAGLFSGGETLVDVLTCDTVTVDGDGGVSVSAKSGLPQVLVSADKLSSSGELCTSQAKGTSGAVGMGMGVRVGGWAMVGLVGVVSGVMMGVFI
ncbi:glycoside hydrolase family 13 protein [Collybiopsis luxurians FD-317 M1]|nr:glycoside hydrolase family 13 protein [Collybiopsis luxurians FD-317 M1]